MDPVVLLAMVDRCAVPEVPRSIVYAVALAESGGHRFVIRDNTTKTVHRFHGINAALVFMKTYPSHSLDIGLMQVNTRAHRVDPRDISPCRNILLGSEILSRDMEVSGGTLGSALCLYHRGKMHCGSYPGKVAAFLPRSARQIRPKIRILAKKQSGVRVTSSGGIPEKKNPVLDLSDTTTETDNSGENPADILDPQLRPAEVDVLMER